MSSTIKHLEAQRIKLSPCPEASSLGKQVDTPSSTLPDKTYESLCQKRDGFTMNLKDTNQSKGSTTLPGIKQEVRALRSPSNMEVPSPYFPGEMPVVFCSGNVRPSPNIESVPGAPRHGNPGVSQHNPRFFGGPVSSLHFHVNEKTRVNTHVLTDESVLA